MIAASGGDAGTVVEHKDVVLALLGASAGLSGLVLVFLGLVVSMKERFPPGTKPAIVSRTRQPAVAVLATFGVGIACVGAATAWLVLRRENSLLYFMTISLFLAQLALLLVATAWTVRRALWG